MGKIWIIGSGPSARLADFNAIPKEDIIFGVNGTAGWAPRLDWWFTLDRDPKNLRRMECRKLKGVRCYAALPDEIPLPKNVIRLTRVAQNPKYNKNIARRRQFRNTPEWWLSRWSAVKTLSEIPGKINTGNSLWGALQIAYQANFKKIILIGLDADDLPRVEGGKPNSLLHLPILFESAVAQLKASGVQVFNANPKSKVTCFPRVTFKEALSV